MNEQADIKAAYRSAAEERQLPAAPMAMPDQEIERRSTLRLPRWLVPSRAPAN